MKKKRIVFWTLLVSLACCPAISAQEGGNVDTEAAAQEFGKLLGKKVEFMYPESGDKCYLNNASKMAELFGVPEVDIPQMIQWQADWIKSGGRTINKPTHFEVNNGKF